MGMPDDLELYDLRARPAPRRDAECLQFYEEVYRPSFPDPAIREEVDTWLELLAVEPVPPRPRLHVIVAANRDRQPGESSRIRAGFVCEYYARSGERTEVPLQVCVLRPRILEYCWLPINRRERVRQTQRRFAAKFNRQ